MTRILGVDPGLRACGWGVIQQQGSDLRYLASGTIRPPSGGAMVERLLALHEALAVVIKSYQPSHVALEEVFVSVNGQSTLKLGQARGAILLTLQQADCPIHEYAARLVKKSITGKGAADKQQMQQMVRYLLPHSEPDSADAADALAVAICHAHFMQNPALTHAAV